MKKMIAMLLAMLLSLAVPMGSLAQEAATNAEAAIASEETVEPQATPDIEDVDDAEEWLYAEDEELWDDEDFEEDELAVLEGIDDEGDVWLDEEDTVEDVLLSAMEVYSWFVLYPLDVDYDKPNAAGDRYQVLDERFNTMQSLRDFVSLYFSDEIVEDLFSMGVYEEENGFLYATDEGRQFDEHIGETEFEVAEETENKIIYHVNVTYWEDDEASSEPQEELFTYTRELIDGEWKFTEFPFFW